MKRSTVEKVLLVLVAGLALVAFGCDDDDDGVGGASGDVNVAMTMAPEPAAPTIAQSPDARIFVHFTYLALTQDGQADEVLIDGPDAEPVEITADDVIGPFNVPPGTYDGFAFTIDDIDVVDGPEGEFTCEQTDLDGDLPIEQGPTVFENGVLEVQEDGTYTILVELPVFGATCADEGAVATIDLLADPSASAIIVD
jgi:hypothetical protein